MVISSGALELAVFRILQRHQVTPGEMVAFDELQQGWSHTGLRASDLRDALRSLVDKGCLECPPDGPDLMFRLTDSGQAYFGLAASREDDRHLLEEAEARLAQLPAIGRQRRRTADRNPRLN